MIDCKIRKPAVIILYMKVRNKGNVGNNLKNYSKQSNKRPKQKAVLFFPPSFPFLYFFSNSGSRANQKNLICSKASEQPSPPAPTEVFTFKPLPKNVSVSSCYITCLWSTSSALSSSNIKYFPWLNGAWYLYTHTHTRIY